MMRKQLVVGLGAWMLLPQGAWAEAQQEKGLIHVVNWYVEILSLFVDRSVAERFSGVFSSAVVLLLIVCFGLYAGLYRKNPEIMTDDELLPPKKFGVLAFLELCWAVISSTLKNVIGSHVWERYVPLLGGTFLFILICNLSGLIPGFTPATTQMNLTLAMGLIIFIAFNAVGLKAAGFQYIKHLAGPVIYLSVLIFPIELFGLCVRPISLSLRLFGNISGDHLVFAAFLTLLRDFHIPWFPFPVGALLFGTLVAALQAFIFMTLSAVYIKLSLDTAQHHGGH